MNRLKFHTPAQLPCYAVVSFIRNVSLEVPPVSVCSRSCSHCHASMHVPLQATQQQQGLLAPAATRHVHGIRLLLGSSTQRTLHGCPPLLLEASQPATFSSFCTCSPAQLHMARQPSEKGGCPAQVPCTSAGHNFNIAACTPKGSRVVLASNPLHLCRQTSILGAPCSPQPPRVTVSGGCARGPTTCCPA